MTQHAPLRFYAANTPNGQKISIFLKEAKLRHEQVDVDLSRGDQHTHWFREINPNGKIPAIVEPDTGVVLFESGAILTYLASSQGQLWPASKSDRLSVHQWVHFQVGGIGPMLGQLWWFLHGAKSQNSEAIERYRKESLRLIDVVDKRLAASPYIAADAYTIADVAAFPWLRTHDELQLDLTPFPQVRRWLAEIEARPAVQEGLAALRPNGSAK
jgi:GST-like protein